MGNVELVGGLATVVAVGGLAPQVARLRRTGDCAGLCLAWPLLGGVTEAGWVAYTFESGLWLALVPSVILMAFDVSLAVLIVRRAEATLVAPALVAMWAGVLILVTATLGWPALGLVLGGSYAVQIAPLLWSAFRTADPSGIAPLTWVAALVEFALWWWYGLVTDDRAIVVMALIGLATSAALVARAHVAHHRLTAPAAPLPVLPAALS